MKNFRCLILGALFLGAISGCGQTTVETLKVPTQVSPNAPGKGMTMVVLPFADYSYADNLASAHRRHLAISEALSDNLTSNGFNMPVQEDVFQFLVDETIISLGSYEQTNTSSLSDELNNDWSEAMKEKIQFYINMQHAGKRNTVANSPGTHGLSEENIMKLGRRFGADYIMRGRILEFRTRQEHSWAPWKTGVLPFVIGTTSQVAYGFADSDQYDNWNHMAAGAVWGGIIGSDVGGPWNPDDPEGFFGWSGGHDANIILWSTVGAGLGHMAQHSGKIDQAQVQIRIWVQDATTGHVVWTNRVDVKVSPESVMADRQLDTLFDQAINQGTATLINDFVTTAL